MNHWRCGISATGLSGGHGDAAYIKNVSNMLVDCHFVDFGLDFVTHSGGVCGHEFNSIVLVDIFVFCIVFFFEKNLF